MWVLYEIYSVKSRVTNTYQSLVKSIRTNDFLLYISYKTTIFENFIPKSILVRF
jgi:hypothetical protein